MAVTDRRRPSALLQPGLLPQERERRVLHWPRHLPTFNTQRLNTESIAWLQTSIFYGFRGKELSTCITALSLVCFVLFPDSTTWILPTSCVVVLGLNQHWTEHRVRVKRLRLQYSAVWSRDLADTVCWEFEREYILLHKLLHQQSTLPVTNTNGYCTI